MLTISYKNLSSPNFLIYPLRQKGVNPRFLVKIEAKDLMSEADGEHVHIEQTEEICTPFSIFSRSADMFSSRFFGGYAKGWIFADRRFLKIFRKTNGCRILHFIKLGDRLERHPSIFGERRLYLLSPCMELSYGTAREFLSECSKENVFSDDLKYQIFTSKIMKMESLELTSVHFESDCEKIVLSFIDDTAPFNAYYGRTVVEAENLKEAIGILLKRKDRLFECECHTTRKFHEVVEQRMVEICF